MQATACNPPTVPDGPLITPFEGEKRRFRQQSFNKVIFLQK